MKRTKLEKIMARFLENSGEKERFRHALMNHGGDGAYSVEGRSVYLWARRHLESIQPRQHTFETTAYSTLSNKPGRATRLIERLAGTLPMSRINRVPGGGQLLYY